MIRHRHEDESVAATFEAPAADVAEQHQPTDPVELAEDTPSEAVPAEADPADATEQAEAVAVDDELRADPPTYLLDLPEDSE